MKLFVLGATGGTGVELVRQAPVRGHSVTAFGRSAAAPPAVSVAGDVADARGLEPAMRGHDAVVFTLGPRNFGPTTLCSTSMRAVLPAMQAAGVRRIVGVSLAILFPGILGPIGAIGRYILRHGAADALEMERALAASPLDYTIVRPPPLTNGAGSGRWRAEVDALPRFGLSIARADLAAFVLEILEKSLFTRSLVGVAR